MSDQIEIITLNCWGLKFISQSTDDRIAHIATELAASTADIICLQEIWQQKHWQRIQLALSATLPYTKYYYSGMMGSGLAILSRFPILETDMRPYTLNGRPQAFFRGDWYVGKGVASAILALPNGSRCQVFNTHMHAPYNEKVDTYLCHRTAQGWDLRKILRSSVQAGYITFATGDFNSIPGSLVHRFLTTHLSDSFVTLNPHLPLLPPNQSELSASELVGTYGMTCDISPTNTWRAIQAPGMHGKRLDYVFHDHRSRPTRVEVIFTDLVKAAGCSASDHFGLRCVYTLESPSTSAAMVDRPLYLKDYDEMQEMLRWYQKRERTHSSRRIKHFWVSIAGILLCSAWQLQSNSRFLHFMMRLLSLTSGVVAVIQGLLGFVFGWWELRSLQEFEDEIRRARALHNGS